MEVGGERGGHSRESDIILQSSVHVALHVEPRAGVPLRGLSVSGCGLCSQLCIPYVNVGSIGLQRHNGFVGLYLIPQLGQLADDELEVL